MLALGIAALLWGCTQLERTKPSDGTPEDMTTTTTAATTTTTLSSSSAAETTAATVTTTTTAPTTVTTAKPTTTAATTRPTTPPAEGHYVQKQAPSWNLLLVNPWNPLPSDYNYTANLTTYATKKEFDTRAIDALRQMINAGKAYGLSAASLYRPYELQTTLYQRKVTEYKNRGYAQAEAERLAATVVARPGTSEHHTGLAVDILGSGYSSLEQSFDNTPAFAWLKAHCAEYGFILRYPKEKEDVTGVIYEPWHYRYVGKDYAEEIMRRGITLEEFLEEKGW